MVIALTCGGGAEVGGEIGRPLHTKELSDITKSLRVEQILHHGRKHDRWAGKSLSLKI